jgi:hypothetical protein
MSFSSECRHWIASSLPFPASMVNILILAILVFGRHPGDESTSDPSTGVSANTLMTQAGKRKVTANPTPLKKARKTMGKSTGGIKIN